MYPCVTIEVTFSEHDNNNAEIIPGMFVNDGRCDSVEYHSPNWTSSGQHQAVTQIKGDGLVMCICQSNNGHSQGVRGFDWKIPHNCAAPFTGSQDWSEGGGERVNGRDTVIASFFSDSPLICFFLWINSNSFTSYGLTIETIREVFRGKSLFWQRRHI